MKLGTSVYLHVPIEEQIPYLEKLYEYGFRTLFTSLHIPEDDVSLYADRLKQLGAFSKQKGIKLVCDVSPQSMDHLNLSWSEAGTLTDWGVTGLRIDYGIDAETVAHLAMSFDVVLNASTIKPLDLKTFEDVGVPLKHVEAWHNFYPRPETGLGREVLKEMTEILRQAGVTSMAFIPGDKKRGPLYEGLPTLEEHRSWSPFAAWLDFYQQKTVETVLVGDPELGEQSLRQFQLFFEKRVILLRAKAFQPSPPEIVEHGNRPDEARDVIRSVQSRGMAKKNQMYIEPSHTVARPIGSVTIDNERYGRYQGEIQLTKQNLSADHRVNVLGRIIAEDRPLLQQIKGNQLFTIEWVEMKIEPGIT
ncbi:MupG family TIM beta-alpha barrel fold protein [Shouchella sp. 1P09AA]|uniref:DUF871 domain-containing protein n=1 Tax=unclassified Shouchella TaxID=2893065 RepID=UPI0039A33FA4